MRGCTLGIVGESSSGKSLTSLAIMGLVPKPNGKIKSGSIVFHTPEGKNSDLLQFPEKEMRHWRGKKIAMIFQEPMTSLNPAYRCGKQVMENILEHEKVTRSEARARTLDLFREVMLPDPQQAFNSYPQQISGGQKQRVMIAMALACNPDILIADEPTTALDVTVQKTILELLRTLQKKHNISLIFISHNLDVIAEIAADVLVMYKGKIVEKGSIEQIVNHPKHPYTKALFNAIPNLHTKSVEDLTTIEGDVPSAINLPPGCRFHPRCESCMEICSLDEPESKMIENRYVKCHLYNDHS